MSMDLEMDPREIKCFRLRRCVRYSRRLRKRTLQMNTVLQREMTENISHINQSYNNNLALTEKVANRQRDSFRVLQAKLRVFEELKTDDLMNEISGADYELALKKIIDDEIEKELRLNDSKSISQRYMHKAHDRAYSKMIELTEKFKRFDTRLVRTPVSEVEHVFTVSNNSSRDFHNKKLALPYLMLNPLFENQRKDSENVNINYVAVKNEFERLYELNE